MDENSREETQIVKRLVVVVYATGHKGCVCEVGCVGWGVWDGGGEGGGSLLTVYWDRLLGGGCIVRD